MKKMFVVLFMFFILIGECQPQANFSLLNYFSGEYSVYTSNAEGSDCIDLGFCYMNSKPVHEQIQGESLVINNLEISSAIKTLNARVVKTEYLDNGTIVIYAFSSLIPKNVIAFDEKVNLQIATKDDRSVIGWPLILGSY